MQECLATATIDEQMVSILNNGLKLHHFSASAFGNMLNSAIDSNQITQLEALTPTQTDRVNLCCSRLACHPTLQALLLRAEQHNSTFTLLNQN